MDMGQENQAGATSKPPSGSLRRVDQVCELAAEGFTDKQIAEALSISRHTVVNYWRRLREHYKQSTRTALVIKHLNEKNRNTIDNLEKRNKDLAQQNGKLISENAKLMRHLDQKLNFFKHTNQVFESAAVFSYRTEIEPPYRCYEISASAALFGINVNEFLANGCSWLDVVVDEDIQSLTDIVSADQIHFGERVSYLYRIKGPEPIWILDIQRAMPATEGNDACYFGIVINVTDLVKGGVLRGQVARLCHNDLGLVALSSLKGG